MARVRLELPDSYIFETELSVRVSDVNHGGHLGNDRVLAFVGEARARFFQARGVSEMDVGGVGIVMADAVVSYRAEAFFGDRLRIRLGARDFNRYGCDLVYLIERLGDGDEVARAKTGIVCFDYSERRIAKASPAFLALFPNAP